MGWECVGFSEIEPFPCALLAHHYPNVPNLGDVTKITEKQIKDLGHIDLVVFGSPCQNLSVAGNRQGLQGQSSGLFYDAIRIIRWARVHGGARFALWENVPGAFSSNKGDDFTEVVRALSGCEDINTSENGWGNSGVAVGDDGLTEWRTLDAQYFGLAQRRKRVFALTDFGDWAGRPPILFEQESLSRDNPPSRETGQNPTANAQNGVGEVCQSNDLKPVFFEQRYDDKPVVIAKDVAPTLTAGMGTAGTNHIYTAYPINTMTCQGRPSDNGRMGIGLGAENDPSPTLSTAHSHAVYKDPKCVGVIAGNIIGRGDGAGGNGAGVQEDISYTLTATDRHAVITDFVVRRLTPVECERLQGFPDDYTNIPHKGKPAPNSPRYKALGNSMAVPVMRWIGERIEWALNQPKISLE